MPKIRKVFVFLSILFAVLIFAGAGCVIMNHGTVSPGYACIPMVFALAALSASRGI